MPDVLQNATSWLAGVLKGSASVSVTVSRGAQSVTLLASPGSTLMRTTDREGNTKVERTDVDFDFTAADHVLGGVVCTPRRGDRWSYTGPDGKTAVYEVTAPGQEAPWRYLDPYRTMLRVHCKLTSPAVPSSGGGGQGGYFPGGWNP